MTWIRRTLPEVLPAVLHQRPVSPVSLVWPVWLEPTEAPSWDPEVPAPGRLSKNVALISTINRADGGGTTGQITSCHI